ncbi:hypothetical protein HanIR_Chr12g0581401 [Helianthus annuus]|nr:hypothetical protein HanIR_Chr12g0581401 [Helianthus annuus]
MSIHKDNSKLIYTLNSLSCSSSMAYSTSSLLLNASVLISYQPHLNNRTNNYLFQNN